MLFSVILLSSKDKAVAGVTGTNETFLRSQSVDLPTSRGAEPQTAYVES